MVRRILPPIFVLLLTLAFAPFGRAAVVFGPNEKAKYIAPGEEEMSGNAQELFHAAQEAETRKDPKKALRIYRTLVRKYPHDTLAPGAGFRCAQLQEETRDYINAAGSYRWIVEKYPASPHFNDAIEAQFRIGELYLNGKKIKVLGLSVGNALDRAVEIFAGIIRSAPYGKYTARAQFDIGRAREKEGANDAALQAYQAVVDKFPSSPVAADAQYQIGYIWFTAAKQGTKDQAATNNARTAFEDFLFKFPNSEKVAQVRSNLAMLDKKQTGSAFSIAQYYDRQKYYRAAVLYYNEVIRQQPGSSESDKAKKRIDQLRSKLGEDAIKPGFAAAEAETAKKKGGDKQAAARNSAGGGEASRARGSANDAAPLPPPEQDSSLPPPASVLPDSSDLGSGTSLGGGLGGGSSSGSSSSSSAEPNNSPSADADASPAP